MNILEERPSSNNYYYLEMKDDMKGSFQYAEWKKEVIKQTITYGPIENSSRADVSLEVM